MLLVRFNASSLSFVHTPLTLVSSLSFHDDSSAAASRVEKKKTVNKMEVVRSGWEWGVKWGKKGDEPAASLVSYQSTPVPCPADDGDDESLVGEAEAPVLEGDGARASEGGHCLVHHLEHHPVCLRSKRGRNKKSKKFLPPGEGGWRRPGRDATTRVVFDAAAAAAAHTTPLV